MKLYRLTFKCLSSMTKIPDAQTIFGAICNIIKLTKGEDELKKYLHSFDEKPLFVHSSMFPSGLLPMTKIGLLKSEEKNKELIGLASKDQLRYLSDMKKFKKISYVSVEIFLQYLMKEKFSELKSDIQKGKILLNDGIVSSNTMNGIVQNRLIVHNNTSAVDDERKLYYDNNQYFGQNSNFDIYVKTNDINYVENIFKYAPYFGFGNRVSVGKNCFQLIEIDEMDNISVNSDYCILLSKCTSDEFDLVESSYMLNSSIFSGSKYYSSNKIGRFNSFVEGSYMKVKTKKEFYGKLIACNNGKPIFHYGIGFIL